MIKLILRWLLDLFIWFLAVVVGFIAYPLLPKDKFVKLERGQGIFKWKWADKIWGNEKDGLTGDFGYYRDHVNKSIKDYPKWSWPFMAIIVPLRKKFPHFWWACVRNPANNLERHIGPSGIVTSIERKKDLTIFTVDRNGKKRKGFFYYTPHNTVMFKIGYKFWPDAYKVGDRFDGALAFSIQKGHKN
ncbi:hypothetical protein D6779_07055 [Candidatus Parcubacteria bacterium]|nr:MAG: hypothetical protein D6779_07055 [Candidatus Parcubacteria bacterium]